jgi:hypothetical protein
MENDRRRRELFVRLDAAAAEVVSYRNGCDESVRLAFRVPTNMIDDARSLLAFYEGDQSSEHATWWLSQVEHWVGLGLAEFARLRAEVESRGPLAGGRV